MHVNVTWQGKWRGAPVLRKLVSLKEGDHLRQTATLESTYLTPI